MLELSKVLEAINVEKRDMVNRGTPYRRATAIYASNLLHELIASNYAQPLTKEDSICMVKSKFQVGDEHAHDVTKTILMQVARIKERTRLANYYEEADKRLNRLEEETQ